MDDGDVPETHRSQVLAENPSVEALQRAHRFHQECLEVRVFAPPEGGLLLRRRAAQQLRGFLGEGEEVDIELQGRWAVVYAGMFHCVFDIEAGGRILNVSDPSKGPGRITRTPNDIGEGWTHRAEGHVDKPKFDLIKAEGGRMVIKHWHGAGWAYGVGTRSWEGDPAESVLVCTHRKSTVEHILGKAVAAFEASARPAEGRGEAPRWEWGPAAREALRPANGGGGGARLRHFDWWTGEARAPLDGGAEAGGALAPDQPEGRAQAMLLLDVHARGEEFEVWQEGLASVAVCRWDEEAGRPSLAPGDLRVLRVPPAADGPAAAADGPAAATASPLVGAVRAAAAEALGCGTPSRLALVPLGGGRAGQSLLDDAQTLSQSGVSARDVLCAEVCPADSSGPRSAARPP